MNAKAWIVTLASSVLLACSSSPSPGFPDQTGDDSGPPTGSSGGGSSGSGYGSSSGGGSGGSSGGASSGGGSSGSSGGSSGGVTVSEAGVTALDGGGHGVTWGTQIPASDLQPTITLTAQSFQVAAGAEVYMCQVFANPFNGVDTDIVSMTGTMSAGSHHFFLFNMAPADILVEPAVGTLGPCAGAGLEFHPFPFLSQQPNWTVNFPTDSNGKPMGYPLVGSNYLMINVHYLNTSAEALTATVNITLTPAKAGVVETHVGSIFLNQTTLSVPASATTTDPYDATMSWGGDPGIMPASYSIFTSWSHMHQWGLKFTASTGSNTFYTETNWDSPSLYIHAPNMPEPTTATGPLSPIQMNNNPGITWTCAYYNNTGATLTFGDSARSNVMCIYIGQYYPADATNPDDIAVLN